MAKTVLYFYVHSIERIQKDFPKLKDPQNVYKQDDCDITWGWGGKDMMECCDQIIQIDKQLSNGCYILLNPPEETKYDLIYSRTKYSWDPKLGDVLEVELDPHINGYYFINKSQHGTITISKKYQHNSSFGVIKNMPIESMRKKNRLLSRL